MSDAWYGPIIDSIVSDVVGSAYGAILSGIGLGDDSSQQTLAALDQIQQTLGVIETQIADLYAEVEDAEKEIIRTVNWDTLVAAVLPYVEAIENNYRLLTNLQQGDTQTANQVMAAANDTEVNGILNCLTVLQAAIVGKSSLGSGSLLQLWVDGNIENAVAPTWSRGSPNAPAFVAASNSITTYFRYLVGLQFKALILLINGKAPLQSDSPQQKAAKENAISGYLAGWTSDRRHDANSQNAGLSRQVEMYRSGMEKLTVYYFCDQSLLGYLSGPYAPQSPILLADQVVSQLFPDNLFAVRIWGGRGSAPAAFDTGTLNTTGEGPRLTLVSTTPIAIPPPDDPTGRYVSFTPPYPNNPSQSSQWSMYRYTFRNLPAGAYQLSPAVPNRPFYNCWANWSSFPHYAVETPSFAVTADPPGGSFLVSLTGTAT